MRGCGSLSNKKIGLSSNLDEIDTDMSSDFPIQNIVSVGFSSLDGANYFENKISKLLE